MNTKVQIRQQTADSVRMLASRPGAAGEAAGRIITLAEKHWGGDIDSALADAAEGQLGGSVAGLAAGILRIEAQAIAALPPSPTTTPAPVFATASAPAPAPTRPSLDGLLAMVLNAGGESILSVGDYIHGRRMMVGPVEIANEGLLGVGGGPVGWRDADGDWVADHRGPSIGGQKGWRPSEGLRRIDIGALVDALRAGDMAAVAAVGASAAAEVRPLTMDEACDRVRAIAEALGCRVCGDGVVQITWGDRRPIARIQLTEDPIKSSKPLPVFRMTDEEIAAQITAWAGVQPVRDAAQAAQVAAPRMTRAQRRAARG